jgi:hypothetical protein
MSEPFHFSAAAMPQTEVTVDVKPAPPAGSDDERIATARAVGISHDRAASKLPDNGFSHHSGFFVDRGFGSPWLARHLLFMVQTIDTPAGLVGKYLRDSSSFNPMTGIFESSQSPLRLEDLIAAFKLRVEELGISQAMLEEWSSTLHTIAEDKEFHNLPFEQRIERFKAKA